MTDYLEFTYQGGGRYVLRGHIAETEAGRLIAAHGKTLVPGGSVEQYWAVLEPRTGGDDRIRHCHVRLVPASTPDAVAVTTVFAFEEVA